MREEDVPDAHGSACPYTAAVTAAAGMSEQALAQWMDSFPADGHPELPPPSVTQQDKAMVSSACSCRAIHPFRMTPAQLPRPALTTACVRGTLVLRMMFWHYGMFSFTQELQSELKYLIRRSVVEVSQ